MIFKVSSNPNWSMILLTHMSSCIFINITEVHRMAFWKTINQVKFPMVINQIVSFLYSSFYIANQCNE